MRAIPNEKFRKKQPDMLLIIKKLMKVWKFRLCPFLQEELNTKLFLLLLLYLGVLYFLTMYNFWHFCAN